MNSILQRTEIFCTLLGVRLPILLAPMAGASAPALSIAIANAGGLGSCGVLLMQPEEIMAWANEVRSKSSGPFQLNIWIPDPKPRRDSKHEEAVRAFLANWGPQIGPEAADATPPEFAAQCDAMLAAKPSILSSVMGLYSPEFVERMKRNGIRWFANVSTVKEALAAEAAGADAIVAQGAEAGGHRGCFDASAAELELVGLFALIPAIVDRVKIPVIATGGIADSRGVAAALVLGASGVQIGTGFLRCPEAKIHPAWADAISATLPEDTIISRVFSGRAGRSISTNYVRAALAEGSPAPASYPVQRALTAAMRADAQQRGDVQRMQAWAGQAAALAQAKPAAELLRDLWEGAKQILP